MYHTILSKQKAFFASGKTRSLAFRRQALETLRQGLLRHEKRCFRPCMTTWENARPKPT